MNIPVCWNIAAALTWIATRDEEMCWEADRLCSSESQIAVFFALYAPGTEKPRLEDEFQPALSNGKVKAFATINASGMLQPVPAAEWSTLNIEDSRSGTSGIVATRAGVLLANLKFSIETIKRVLAPEVIRH